MSKIIDLQNMRLEADRLRREGKRLVLPNGCFDILHVGHVMLIEQARALGDALVVALNSDDSVRRLKGSSRPVVDQAARARILAALQDVDFVVIFDTLRATPIITALPPDIFVKGGHYSLETLDASEREALQRLGTEIVFIPVVPQVSTSGILRKVTESAG